MCLEGIILCNIVRAVIHVDISFAFQMLEACNRETKAINQMLLQKVHCSLNIPRMDEFKSCRRVSSTNMIAISAFRNLKATQQTHERERVKKGEHQEELCECTHTIFHFNDFSMVQFAVTMQTRDNSKTSFTTIPHTLFMQFLRFGNMYQCIDYGLVDVGGTCGRVGSNASVDQPIVTQQTLSLRIETSNWSLSSARQMFLHVRVFALLTFLEMFGLSQHRHVVFDCRAMLALDTALIVRLVEVVAAIIQHQRKLADQLEPLDVHAATLEEFSRARSS
jgi:hypothetical protein